MQGKTQVIDQLQRLLRGELAAREQYFTHSRMYHNWGLHKLHERVHHEMEEETQTVSRSIPARGLSITSGTAHCFS